MIYLCCVWLGYRLVNLYLDMLFGLINFFRVDYRLVNLYLVKMCLLHYGFVNPCLGGL